MPTARWTFPLPPPLDFLVGHRHFARDVVALTRSVDGSRAACVVPVAVRSYRQADRQASGHLVGESLACGLPGSGGEACGVVDEAAIGEKFRAAPEVVGKVVSEESDEFGRRIGSVLA